MHSPDLPQTVSAALPSCSVSKDFYCFSNYICYCINGSQVNCTIMPTHVLLPGHMHSLYVWEAEGWWTEPEHWLHPTTPTIGTIIKVLAGNRFGMGTTGKRYFHSRFNVTILKTEMTELLWLVHPTFPYLQLSLPDCRGRYLHQDFFELLPKANVFDHIKIVVCSLMGNSHIKDML